MQLDEAVLPGAPKLVKEQGTHGPTPLMPTKSLPRCICFLPALSSLFYYFSSQVLDLGVLILMYPFLALFPSPLMSTLPPIALPSTALPLPIQGIHALTLYLLTLIFTVFFITIAYSIQYSNMLCCTCL